jgi:alpha-ketoglutarate-dependent taurine dioxygenase
VTSLPPEVRDSLLSSFAEAELPRNTYYGDGTPISDETLEEIRRVYREEAIVFPWEEGDVLLADNMLVAHSREPFEGKRKVVVAMADAWGADAAAGQTRNG